MIYASMDYAGALLRVWKTIYEGDNDMIRPAEMRDASRLAEILIFAKRTAYRPIFKNDTVSFNKMQVLDLALTFRDNKHELDDMYVYDDGIVRGLIKWGKENNFKPDCVRIYELFVDTFFQGQGIGSILINDCIYNSKVRHFNKIILWVLEENKMARAFYERHGFKYDGIHKYEDGTTAVLLEYALEL
jgi:putative acetyltransferase